MNLDHSDDTAMLGFMGGDCFGHGKATVVVLQHICCKWTSQSIRSSGLLVSGVAASGQLINSFITYLVAQTIGVSI